MSGVTKPWTVANFGNTLAMTNFFILKIFQVWWRFHKCNKKPRKCFLFLRKLDLNRERQNLTICNRILVIGSPCVNKQPYDFKPQSGRYFPSYFSSQWWKYMVKVLSWRFYYCLEQFNMLTFEGCFETALNNVSKPYTVVNFGNTLAMRIFFSFKMFGIWWRFHKWNKKPRKCFLFLR